MVIIKHMLRNTIFALIIFYLLGCQQVVSFAEIKESDNRNLGINLFASTADWAQDRLFADVMKTARVWREPNKYGSGDLISDEDLDVNGWPTVDAEVIIWHGIGDMNGTYHLEGYSDSSPTITTAFASPDISNFTYKDGKFSADITYDSDGTNGLVLTFTNTGNGVHNVKMMRPLTPGSTESYSTDETFTNEIKSLLSQSDVVRFMWATGGWNGASQLTWADRVSPTYCSFNRNGNSDEETVWAGDGMAWEYAFELCNELGKDIWLNMPLGVEDNYITELARLAKTAYTVPDGKIYWEYSNEATWDIQYITSSYIIEQAYIEKDSGGNIFYDGVTDINILAQRYYAKRSVEMSLLWREVWGDDMMTRIRPIHSGHTQYDSQAIWGLEFVHDWYSNGAGDYNDDPHPVNYYFYGCGGAHYTDSDPYSISSKDSNYTNIEFWEQYEEEEATLAKIYGLKRCAYEGGVNGGDTADEAYSYNIKEAMLAYQELWDKYDGDLLTYYVTTGGEGNGYEHGFTDDIYSQEGKPKIDALKELQFPSKPEAYAGLEAPCIIEGDDWGSTSTPSNHPEPAFGISTGHAQLKKNEYLGYLFRTPKAGVYTVTMTCRKEGGTSTIGIMIDGIDFDKVEMGLTTSSTVEVYLEKGLHGVRYRKYNDGYFQINSISIEPK